MQDTRCSIRQLHDVLERRRCGLAKSFYGQPWPTHVPLVASRIVRLWEISIGGGQLPAKLRRKVSVYGARGPAGKAARAITRAEIEV